MPKLRRRYPCIDEPGTGASHVTAIRRYYELGALMQRGTRLPSTHELMRRYGISERQAYETRANVMDWHTERLLTLRRRRSKVAPGPA